MDPNAAWKEAVRAALEWTNVMDAYENDGGSLDNEHEQAALMADCILRLSEWLGKGGFPPDEFRQTPWG